ncbi:vancomycin high temperature exclusion protein [Chryseobacterium sp. FH1]|uniref:SanA/YdcF family protein n=1 Tax=Chryseobacterium sp. FH1 TaxID=1233951 RepID=UPI0004E39804|nr:ElyC/SanA/YdcF family protein [Chryseobacterium sp. FH1]KFC24751.1 membrane protein [Chryseobacterium sp. FH1]
MKIFKKILVTGLIFFGLSVLFVLYANYTIDYEAEDNVTSDIGNLPNEKVGLLLGTSKILANGKPNPYFVNRIKATAELYHAGRIQNIIASGDNSRKNYNEPEDMKNALIKLGVPADKIYEDFAGFRTLDSVIRAKEIFGQESFIVISQRFHNERAIYLAHKNGITAYGYNAKDVDKEAGFKTNVREKFARVKVFWDFFFGVEPKFGGEKILIK